MGLLDGMLGTGGQGAGNPLSGVFGGEGGNALIGAAMQLLQQHGGLSGLLDLFRSKGLGQQVESWIGSGPNMEVSGEQVEQAFGSGSIQDVAAQSGLSPNETSSSLAQLLPDLIDRLTPDGEVPHNENDLLAQGLALLRGG